MGLYFGANCNLFVCFFFRSPGGTPLLPIKDYSGCGDGIGPVLTRALKRKFEVRAVASPHCLA